MINDIPPELVIHLTLTKLDPASLGRLAQTSFKFSRLASSGDGNDSQDCFRLWKLQYLKYGGMAASPSMADIRDCITTWRREQTTHVASVRENGLALGQIPLVHRTNRVCLAAVRQHGYALEYVPSTITCYPQVCIAAIFQNGCALQHVPVELRDFKTCAIATRWHEHAHKYVPRKWQGVNLPKSWISGECVSVVRRNGRLLRRIPPSRLTHKMCQVAVTNDASAIQYVPLHFRTSISLRD